MSKEVLLIQDVEGLGRQGEIVKVADGYARNFLIPKQKAEPVNAASQKRLAKLVADREAIDKIASDEGEKLVARLEGVSVNITAKASEDKKLYGSVSTADIAEALQAQGVDINKNSIQLEAPIKELGAFDVTIKVHGDLTATVKVWVVEA